MKIKNILVPCLMVLGLMTACRGGEAKKAAEVTTETKEQVEKLEESSEVLDATSEDIKAKEAALESALKELDDIDN